MKIGNMNILDVVVKLVCKETDSSDIPSVDAGYMLLADSAGALLTTSDGFYLAVKNNY